MASSAAAARRHRQHCRGSRSTWMKSLTRIERMTPGARGLAPGLDGPLPSHPHQRMAVNLTPQYLEAEAEYKKAQTPEEKLVCLKKMWTLVPKHKASEKLQAELKTKMSDL